MIPPVSPVRRYQEGEPSGERPRFTGGVLVKRLRSFLLGLLIVAVALYEGMAPSWRLAAVAAGGGLVYWLIFVRILAVEQPTASLF